MDTTTITIETRTDDGGKDITAADFRDAPENGTLVSLSTGSAFSPRPYSSRDELAALVRQEHRGYQHDDITAVVSAASPAYLAGRNLFAAQQPPNPIDTHVTARDLAVEMADRVVMSDGATDEDIAALRASVLAEVTAGYEAARGETDRRYSTCDTCAEAGVIGVNLAENAAGSAHVVGGAQCTDADACRARYDAQVPA